MNKRQKQELADCVCTDCGVNVHDINEYSYMVKPKVWFDTGNDPTTWHSNEVAKLLFCAGLLSQECTERHFSSGGKLCVGCIEERLGRKLTTADFNFDLPITTYGAEYGSARLRDRMGLAR